MQSVPITINGCKFEFCSWRCLLDTTLCDKVCQAKIKNKFVSPYPTDPVKIGQLKCFYWKFVVPFFSLSLSRFAQNSFCWKFHILDSFRQKIDIFALPSTSLSSKKKPTYLPTSKIVGRVRGNRNIFNCGLSDLRQVNGFLWILRFPSPIKLTVTIYRSLQVYQRSNSQVEHRVLSDFTLKIVRQNPPRSEWESPLSDS